MTRTILTMLPAVLLASACQSIGTVDSAELGSVIDLVGEELTAYVQADPDLTPAQKASALAPLGKLRGALTVSDRVSVRDIAPDVDAITVRYFAYLTSDPSLSEEERALYQNTARKLREVVRLEE